MSYSSNHLSNSISLNVKGTHIIDEKDDSQLVSTNDIALPNQKPLNHVGIDIGGSLTKIVYSSKLENGGKLNFESIETSKVEQIIDRLKEVLKLHYGFNPDSDSGEQNEVIIMATGGGAFKYNQLLLDEIKCPVVKTDEMQSLIVGLDFLITRIPDEIFTIDEHFSYNSVQCLEDPNIYPYLLVNIGSGVSMIKVTANNTFTRVSGSSVGGGTLWGLLSILTAANDFDEMLALAQDGNNENVDLLVGDIYGRGYNKIGLSADAIAASMGKAFKKVTADVKVPEDASAEEIRARRLERLLAFDQKDIAKSLLFAISNNIGQIAFLEAQRCGISKIFFAGSYIRNHPQTVKTLSYAVKFWSNNQQSAYFLRHEGYLGSLGAFLSKRASDDAQ
ncbi:hypothetical protein LJB42_000130 [Komagataella kurtzmanii]|nr:hypothetical protein LJB42_000130 [Komagataella kurtzmanii]